jgi:hypothetical protein
LFPELKVKIFLIPLMLEGALSFLAFTCIANTTRLDSISLKSLGTCNDIAVRILSFIWMHSFDEAKQKLLSSPKSNWGLQSKSTF